MQTNIQFLPRYLRRTEKKSNGLTNDDETTENASKLRKVLWLPNFYALPGTYRLADISTESDVGHKEMNLFPMDISSALPVLTLDIDRTLPCKILDLCCCPGGKLQYLLELAAEGSTVSGVDLSEDRLAVCRSLLCQYQGIGTKDKRSFLFNCDGRTFSATDFGQLVFDSSIPIKSGSSTAPGRFKLNKSARARYDKELKSACSLLKQLATTSSTPLISSETTDPPSKSPLVDFDYVLVDAECTHDASYKHLQYSTHKDKWRQHTHDNRRKRPHSSIDNSTSDDLDNSALIDTSRETTLLSHGIPLHSITDTSHHVAASLEATTATALAAPEDLARENLRDLQRGLIQRGFELLREGGVLVYSTCSADIQQNEMIVRWLLAQYPLTAHLEDALSYIKRHTQTRTVEETDGLCAVDEEILSLLSAPSDSSTAAGDATAEQLCTYFAQLPFPPLKDNVLLPGTLRTGYENGMSGHFVARIRKSALHSGSDPSSDTKKG